MKVLYILVALLLLCSSVMAIPTTQGATLVGNNNVTLNGNGVTGDHGWFQWSMKTGVVYAHLPNVTSNGGTIVYTVKGTPLFGNTLYFFRACDDTGCGAEVQFTTTAVTPIPVPAYGSFATNMTESGFDLPTMVLNSMQAYISVTGDTIFFGLIFALIFVGMWLRTRGTATATSFGMICLSLFTISAGGLGIGLPQEFLAAGQALMYLSLTGAVLAFTFK